MKTIYIATSLIIVLLLVAFYFLNYSQSNEVDGTAIPPDTPKYQEVRITIYSGSCNTSSSGNCNVIWTVKDNFNSSLNYSFVIYQPYNITYYKYTIKYEITRNGKSVSSGWQSSDSPNITLDDILCKQHTPLVVSCPIPSDTDMKLENVTVENNCPPSENCSYHSFYNPTFSDGRLELKLLDSNNNTVYSNSCNYFNASFQNICFLKGLDSSIAGKINDYKTIISIYYPNGDSVLQEYVYPLISGEGHFLIGYT